jgi:outer membrane protein OmpA-like peptidoglycan-associated protein
MKTVLFIVFILLAHMPLRAQQKDQAELKEYFFDAEYFFAEEEYTDALYDYMELFNNGYKENANINYRMGICYLNIPGQKEKAIGHLLEAVKDVSKKYSESNFKQKTAPFDAYLFLGNAYRVNNLLSQAIEAYKKYEEVAATTEEINFANQQITACNTALRFMDNPVQVKLTNLGDSVNDNADNFKGVVSGDGKTLLYMNELPFYDAVYFSRYTPKGWSSPVNITPQLQSDGDQYVASLTYDGMRLFLTKEDAFNSDFYVSDFVAGKWSKSVPLSGQDINTKFWESHASISKDGKTLYFTSNRKDGIGDMDIYVSRLQNNGQWGSPVNLGTTVNTPLNEDTPFITGNDSMLYFSSQGHENMGGYDIFVSKLKASGQWSEPENLRYPINTTDDDLFFYPWNNAEVGYISLIRGGGYGMEDIYAVQPYDAKPLDILLAEFFEKSEKSLAIPLDAIVPAETSAAPVTPAIPVLDITAEPVPAPTPKEIQLDPVYFDFDNFLLSDADKKQIDKLVQLLTDYPVARVMLMGHADARGPAEYNLKLSEKRAEAVMNYITGKGIESVRIETKGLGEKNFAAINSNPDGTDNPEGRRLNRRVEYEIIGSNNTVIIIRMPAIPETLKIRE